MHESVALPERASPSPAGQWLDEHGDALYGYALLRVRRSEVAEDLVQETLLAALAGESRFSARSEQRTWLIGILRHKIVDHFRKSSAGRSQGQSDEAASPDLFNERGAWKVAVPAWRGDPHALLERAEFRDVLAGCLAKLPARAAELFWLREAEGVETDALCQELDLSPANVWTMLHRARSRLRECLTLNWFGAARRR
ncbi:MAG TPA: sigma-70 family RNA polymerase sigma factor [Tepidisphaeraceae bacterium]|jgi:RNA polymerase sigma-70 factor (ECF subfamily)|nr:sigma-70 family RNA polymerase sigma factor [Tepidisphaeraceae bacterium]